VKGKLAALIGGDIFPQAHRNSGGYMVAGDRYSPKPTFEDSGSRLVGGSATSLNPLFRKPCFVTGEQNAGTMQIFGQQIGPERNQQADQYLRAGFFAELPRDPVLRDGHDPGDNDADGNAAGGKPEERSESGDNRERAG
jgi:hypothetical protein